MPVPRELPARGRRCPAEVERARASPSTRLARSARTTASSSRARPCARVRSATRSSRRRVRREADLIVLGSSPRWRRQSRFFSPTVDHVLRNAPCEVSSSPSPRASFEAARVSLRLMKAVVIGCGRVGFRRRAAARPRRVGRHRRRRERGGARAARPGLEGRLRRRPRHGRGRAAPRRDRGRRRGGRRDVGRQHEHRRRPGRPEALRRRVRRRARARPRARGVLREARPPHGLPDPDRDLRARRPRPGVRRATAGADRCRVASARRCT